MIQQDEIIQPVLTDDEILQVFADAVGNQEDDARFIGVDRDQAIRIARALLSKLRAPVAGKETALPDEAYAALEAVENAAPQASAENAYKALSWYAEQVAGCRKFGSDGEAARHALDRDGGERARAALSATKTTDKEQA